MPGDEESINDEAIWEALPVSHTTFVGLRPNLSFLFKD